MCAPFLPKSLLSTSRSEFYDAQGRADGQCSLTLTIKAGLSEDFSELPPDLRGSLFIIAPAGSEDSPVIEDSSKTVLPTQTGSHLLNGDGMVYRVDFSEEGGRFSSRFVETVTYLADKLSHQKYPDLSYFNFGLSRFSSLTGTCNQANTAFLPVSGGEGNPERLLVTWDMGRPVEIDPVSLRLIAPVGDYQSWRPIQQFKSSFTATKLLMTSAHPVVVPDSSEVLVTNVVKSLRGLMSLPRLFDYIFQPSVIDPADNNWIQNLYDRFLSIIQLPVNFIVLFLQFLGVLDRQDVYIVRWNGETDTTESWRVVLPSEKSIKIQQTIHQMGITRDYVVFADTAFKIVLSGLAPTFSLKELMDLGNLKKALVSFSKRLRDYSTFPLLQDTSIYIVDRSQFEETPSGTTVTAQKVVLEDSAVAHFQVDYENKNDEIKIHAALNQNTDFAEFIRREDTSPFGNSAIAERMQQMAGIFTGGMEVNRPATFVIDGKTGVVEHKVSLSDEEAERHTWAMGICAYRDEKPTQKLDNIYWTSFGAWPETVSESLVEMYDDRYQAVPERLKEFLSKVEEGLPTSICRVQIDDSKGRPNIYVADSYEFPSKDGIGYFGNSPQFIPKVNSTGSTDGYIACTVNYSDEMLSRSSEHDAQKNSWSANTEIWIFEADQLHKGPCYRLSHADMNMGMTVHTTWLKEIGSPTKVRQYDVRKDFEAQLSLALSKVKNKEAEQLKQLFEEVFQQVEESQVDAM